MEKEGNCNRKLTCANECKRLSDEWGGHCVPTGTADFEEFSAKEDACGVKISKALCIGECGWEEEVGVCHYPYSSFKDQCSSSYRFLTNSVLVSLAYIFLQL
eukprot:UN24597